ncbi:unnamed protein product [Cylicostephanus goldi]|uniref:Integrase catalytic domain-containing protein n=1 Tax=Cylicostephanus goldi TaxID=71465 RepID=A0A3P6RHE2_CYLGO|nr:unnamed protein product [Cylicostephanus goldi]
MKLSEITTFQQEHRAISLNELQKRFPQKTIIRDENGVIRHDSRLQNALMDFDTKSPIYVNPKSDLARLIIRDLHCKNAHCGKDQTLCLARQRFWIPRPSAAYNKYIRSCTICKRYQGLPFGAPAMPPLPGDRVKRSRPFENVGCDFFGPILDRNDERIYVCLYTRFTTRAVHLEVVENMSTEAFLDCLVRFVSRRVPKLIRTDCGTNFRLGQQILESMFQSDDTTGSSVMTYSVSTGIRWTFNPPAAPWMGGAWERLAGTVKRALQKAFGRKKFTFTQLCTAVTRIEAVINTRPLAKLPSADISEIPLRPVDFLQGNLAYSIPNVGISADRDNSYDPDLIQTALQAKEALEYSETVANKFWERWNTEYLTMLREIQHRTPSIQTYRPERPHCW